MSLRMPSSLVRSVLSVSVFRRRSFLAADFLYGNKDGKDLDRVFDDLKWYDTLLEWKSDQWSDLITRYVTLL